MPGSRTTQGRPAARPRAATRVAFRWVNGVGTPNESFAAQYLAYALPRRRFVPDLTIRHARLGADVDGYSFIVEDLHLLLLAGLPAH